MSNLNTWPGDEPRRGIGRWLAGQWALFTALGIVAGAMFWVAMHAVVVGVVVGCFSFAVGCVIGISRLERWLEVGEEGNG